MNRFQGRVSPLIERASRLAARCHAGQTRKQTDIPYVQHVFCVALILDRMGFGDEVVAAALLHDALEDTALTGAEIEAELGPLIASYVALCSERKLDSEGRKRPWAARKEEHLAQLQTAPLEVCAIVLADKCHNLSATVDDVAAGADALSRFNADPGTWLEMNRRFIDALAQRHGGDERIRALAAECRSLLEKLRSPRESG